MSGSEKNAGNISLFGGRLCLDFINTVDPRWGDKNIDYLKSYSDLLAWSKHVGTLTESAARQLAREADQRPGDAEKVLRYAVAIRESMYRILVAIARELRPAAADLAALNESLAETFSHAQLVHSKQGFAWDWNKDKAALDQVLWPVVRSAAEVLTSDDAARVRECSGSKCGWLFVDVSRNRKRRWCCMQGCGNQAKARRFYQRARATG